jgi:glycerol-1-phosphate dehydrogenase [NAD(P)+]
VHLFLLKLLTGIAMHLAGCSRPASGAEHQISHFIGMKQLADGKLSDFHGKKVGVATIALANVYHKLAKLTPDFNADKTNLDEVILAYGDSHRDFITSQNAPSICDEISVQDLKDKWSGIQKIILEELPDYATLKDVMVRSGSATRFDEIATDNNLKDLALTYHSYMRKKVVLTRLLTMTNVDVCKL